LSRASRATGGPGQPLRKTREWRAFGDGVRASNYTVVSESRKNVSVRVAQPGYSKLARGHLRLRGAWAGRLHFSPVPTSTGQRGGRYASLIRRAEIAGFPLRQPLRPDLLHGTQHARADAPQFAVPLPGPPPSSARRRRSLAGSRLWPWFSS